MVAEVGSRRRPLLVGKEAGSRVDKVDKAVGKPNLVIW